MATYSRELYEKADRVLEDKREKNKKIHEQNLAKLYKKHPNLEKANARLRELYSQVMKKKFHNTDKLELEIATLQDEITEIITKNNIDDTEYLLQFDCPFCKDTGVHGYKICECKYNIVRSLAVKQADTSSSYWNSFKDFDLSYYPDDVGKKGKTKRKIAELVLNAAQNYNGGNALIYGSVGVGKTFLAECIANKWANDGKTVCYYSATRLFLMLNDQYFNKEKRHDLSDKVSLLYEADLLIIDDLGVEFRNSFTESMFFDILNDRLMNKKSMVISTNLSQNDIADLYSDRIYSRIRGNFSVWELLGEDIREKKLRRK